MPETYPAEEPSSANPNAYVRPAIRVARPERLLGTDIKEIADVLKTIETKDRARLPENYFVEIFLPLFCGEPSPYGATFDTWSSAAGGPVWPMDIFDPQTNETLFTVPPLVNMSLIATPEREALSLHNVVLTGNQVLSRSAEQAEAFVHASLDRRLNTATIPQAVRDNAEQWNAIFKRYGKPTLQELGVKSEEEKRTTGGTPGDELTYPEP